MKIQMFKVCGVLLFVFGAVLVNAQSGGYFMKVNVPFDFTVGNETLPQGEYAVKIDVGEAAPAVLIGPHGKRFIPVLPTEKRGTGNAYKLVFNQFNNQYFLSTIWMGNDLNGRKLFISRYEREAIARGEKPILKSLVTEAR